MNELCMNLMLLVFLIFMIVGLFLATKNKDNKDIKTPLRIIMYLYVVVFAFCLREVLHIIIDGSHVF